MIKFALNNSSLDKYLFSMKYCSIQDSISVMYILVIIFFSFNKRLETDSKYFCFSILFII